MKSSIIVLSSLMLSSFAFADMAGSGVQVKQQAVHQEKVEIHNRFHDMKTDELLGMRGTMHNEQDKEQLHNELMDRQKMMTKEQKEKFMRRPDKVSNEMGMQGKGNAYGQGQGMMQGQGKKMMEGGSGMGNKGGR